jgi:membrane associated rhomboid family serine protease
VTEPKPKRGIEGAAARAGRVVADFRRIQAREAKSAPGTEPDFDPTSWSGALILMGGFTAIVWVVQIVNAANNQRLDRFGLLPRHVNGLWGVLTQPFLHASYGQLFSDSVPMVLIGWVLLLSGVRTWLFVTATVIIVGGAATWLVAPSDRVLIGASSLVFGWMGYLIARAIFSRRIKWIITAAALLIFFGTLLGSLLPSFDHQTSWQSHLCGFLAGAFVGWLLHPRTNPRAASKSPRRPAVS